MEKTFIVTYHLPRHWSGTYLVKGVDGPDACEKASKLLTEKLGAPDSDRAVTESSSVIEVLNGHITIL